MPTALPPASPSLPSLPSLPNSPNLPNLRSAPPRRRHWDVFCRVIDNHGDIGVCWRLARGLASTGDSVRLWVDEPSALAWMAPAGGPSVQVLHWTAPAADLAPDLTPGDVVVEAFGCDPPPAFVARMATAATPPVWINLEYLSAEAYVARSHGLASPQWQGPGRGLVKWFFYPGFTAGTGGLLQGDGATRAAPPTAPPPSPAALSATSAAAPAAPRQVLLFAYANPQLPHLLSALALDGPVLLRVPPGAAAGQLADLPLPTGLRWQPQPLLSQPDFDALLSVNDLNLVRGEDSFVRAQLASDAPWLWQAYPQGDGAHGPKLEAFLALYLAYAPPALAADLGQAFRAWNGLAPWPARLPDHRAWRAHQQRWRARQLAQASLIERLLAFADAKSDVKAR